jgi:spore maturation protein CgeB
MNQKLNIALFAHSMVSDWNHGNAHFLRGLMRELVRMGHTVRCYEELSS